MVPARDWAPPPSFPTLPFNDGNGHQPRSGPGPASLNSGYGSTHRSINYGVPFGKGMGVFSRSGQRPVENSAPVSNQLGEILGTGTASNGDQQVTDFGRGFAAHRKRDFSSVGMRSPPSLSSQVRRLDRDADLVETTENR